MEKHFAQILVCLRRASVGILGTRAQLQQNKTDPGFWGRGKRSLFHRVQRGTCALREPLPCSWSSFLFRARASARSPAKSTLPCWRALALGGTRAWIPFSGAPHLDFGRRQSKGATGPDCFFFLLPKSCVTFRPAFSPWPRTRRVQVSLCSSFLRRCLPSPSFPTPCPQLPDIALLRGGPKPSSPGTYTWPQRVRTGWCNTSRHTAQSKDVTGNSGSPLRSRARGVAEGGADLPLSLLSTDPIAVPLAQTAAKHSVPAAGLFCCRAVEEGSPGPAAIAASQRAQLAQPRSNLRRCAQPWSRAGRVRGRGAEIFCKPPRLRRGGGGGSRQVLGLVVLGGLKPETLTAEKRT